MVVSLEKRGVVGVVHLNRPPANSYNKDFMDELNASIDEIRFDDEIRVAVVVSDLERFFSAGADINMFRDSSPTFNRAIILHAHEVLEKISRTSKVFIAAISGHSLGGGLEIALACDLRFAAEGEYRIGLPESNLGLLPGNGGTQRLPRLIGRSRALDLMLTGSPVGPRQALELGIVDKLIPADALQAETLAYASRLGEGPSLAHGNIKLATVLGIDLPLSAGLALERQLVQQLFESDDAREGFSAFIEKRAPQWTGR